MRRGSALIVVLLLLALLIVLTAEVTVRSATDGRAMENSLTEVQAQAGLQGAFVHAVEALKMDLRADEKALQDLGTAPADWYGEAWATAVSSLPLGDGTYGFAVTDEQARWNLNALVDANGAAVPAAQEQLHRLLESLCPLAETSAFEAALVDWVDRAQPETGSWEEGAPNRPLVTTKELWMVPGATSEILVPLLPHLTRWTTGQVNANTCSREVLRAIWPALSDPAWAAVVAGRPFRSTDDLRAPLGLDVNQPLPPELASVLTVRTTFFRVALSFDKGGDVRRATAIALRVTGQPARLWWDPDPVSP